MVESLNAYDDELTKRKDQYLAKQFSEVRQELITANQDLKEDLDTSERGSREKFNGLQQSIDIYCEVTLQNSFASYLSMEFRRKGFYASVICNETLNKIEEASASVVVFSNSCFSSISFLDTLVRVVQCQRKSSQLIVPVFYGISPSDVVVPDYDSGEGKREWSYALQELKKVPGYQLKKECSEYELVEEIVKDVYEKLLPTKQIGIESRLLEIEQLLCKQHWGIRRIGIWGMPGIGKTTLAQAFFDQISRGYEASCFINDFDKAFHEKGLHHLLEEHFGKFLEEFNNKITLVVLDDVHNPLVAESFLRGIHWFGLGSLIIITSRDKQVFRHCQINHVYEVQSLNQNEALQLFSQCAFGKDRSEQYLLDLSKEVINYANGNPLALSFYGGELKGKTFSEMVTTFLRLKHRIPNKIHDLFKSSYELLDEREKNIFLDIACFFNGDKVEYVMQLLEGCGFFPHVGIDVLVEKCLVTIAENRVKMHNLVQHFGLEIINREAIHINRRRRLWEPRTIKFLLENDKTTSTWAKDTGDIEGIFLDTSSLFIDMKPTAFEDMFNLRFLKIYNSSYENSYELSLPKGLESLPYELRLLHWEYYPLQSLPQDFDPCHLVELNMPYSQLHKLWGGTKNLEMLKIVRLCHSEHLTEIDDILKAQNIELIDLRGCANLQSFPATGQLQHLRVVNLSSCTEIRSFPEFSSSIEELQLEGTGIKDLPISVVSLVKLVLLNLKDCSHFQSLPQMVDLESLEVLDLSGCSNLKSIEGFPRNLKELYLVSTAIKELPSLPSSIELLNARSCVSLVSIPSGFDRLPKYYTFSNCFALSEQVVSEFLKNALSNVDRITREYHQQKELKKSLAFSLTVPSAASKEFTFDLQPGSSVIIQLGSSWKKTLGFAILLEVSFLEDYQEANGFGINYVCRWKDKEFVSHKLENDLRCWNPGEGVRKDHMFVFCDLNLHSSICEGNDLSILADLVVFEFFTVNMQNKLVHESCTVKKCGVHVITAANDDTSFVMTQPLSSSDYLHDEVEEVLSVIYNGLDANDRNIFLYIACLFNDEKVDFLEPLIASIDLGISSRLQVLANKSLLRRSPYGIVVRHGLLQKIGREIVHRLPCEKLIGGPFVKFKTFRQSFRTTMSSVLGSSNLSDREYDNVSMACRSQILQ